MSAIPANVAPEPPALATPPYAVRGASELGLAMISALPAYATCREACSTTRAGEAEEEEEDVGTKESGTLDGCRKEHFL